MIKKKNFRLFPLFLNKERWRIASLLLLFYVLAHYNAVKDTEGNVYCGIHVSCVVCQCIASGRRKRRKGKKQTNKKEAFGISMSLVK